MTNDPDDDQGVFRSAIARAALALPASDPRAHVFLEDRTDVRTTVSSSGHREVRANRTRGAAVAGLRSMHVTDPDFLDLGRATPEILAGSFGLSRREHEDWVARLQGAVVAAGTSACMGRRHPYWSANLVSFHQHVWVGRPNSDVLHDVRQGCRLEIRARIGTNRFAHAVEDQVLRPGDLRPVTEAFVRAFDHAERRTTTGPPPGSGSTTAVFAPGAAGVVIHELVGHALEADVVARGPTWIGASLCSGATPLTVIDDPRLGRGAWAIDDEGSLAGETLLIDRGRPVGMLHDRASAERLGARLTGHGRRASYLDAVLPRMGCTFIQSGVEDPEDVLRSTPRGVFIRRLTGGHTDPMLGSASFVVTDADRIVDGRLAEPLDIFALELDALESWGSIDRVGHDLAFDTCVGSCLRDGQPIAISVGAPTIRIGVVGVRS